MIGTERDGERGRERQQRANSEWFRDEGAPTRRFLSRPNHRPTVCKTGNITAAIFISEAEVGS